MKPYSKIKIAFLLVFTFNCGYAQEITFKNYSLGTVPEYSQFDKWMLPYEISIDSMLNESNTIILNDLLGADGFVAGTSEKDKQEAISNHKAASLRYKDNRSHVFLERYRNGKTTGDELIPMSCDCHLSKDTLKISMGVLLANESFEISVLKDKYHSYYKIADDTEPTYKLDRSSKRFLNSINLGFVTSQLILGSTPKFFVGENLFGYMEYKTRDFFKQEGWESGFNETKTNTLSFKGGMFFKCTIRDNIYGR